MPQELPTKTKNKKSLDEHYQLIYSLDLACLYHETRAHFFGIYDKTVKAIALIFSSAVLSWVISPFWITLFATIIAISSSLSLVIDLNGLEKKHNDLTRRFKTLLAEITLKGDQFEESDLFQWH